MQVIKVVQSRFNTNIISQHLFQFARSTNMLQPAESFHSHMKTHIITRLFKVFNFHLPAYYCLGMRLWITYLLARFV
ncbi:hypothetical protein Hanom_Chr01g00041741 [Helianthus anomalus]